MGSPARQGHRDRRRARGRAAPQGADRGPRREHNRRAARASATSVDDRSDGLDQWFGTRTRCRWSMRRDQAMPSRPGRAVVVDEVGVDDLGERGDIATREDLSRVRRAIALMSWEMSCSIGRSCRLVVHAALWTFRQRFPGAAGSASRNASGRSTTVKWPGVLDHVQRPAVADAGLSGPGWPASGGRQPKWSWDLPSLPAATQRPLRTLLAKPTRAVTRPGPASAPAESSGPPRLSGSSARRSFPPGRGRVAGAGGAVVATPWLGLPSRLGGRRRQPARGGRGRVHR